MSPYVSNAQRKYFHAHQKELAAQGVNIKEWDRATAGRKLPEHVKNKKKKKGDSSIHMAI